MREGGGRWKEREGMGHNYTYPTRGSIFSPKITALYCIVLLYLCGLHCHVRTCTCTCIL